MTSSKPGWTIVRWRRFYSKKRICAEILRDTSELTIPCAYPKRKKKGKHIECAAVLQWICSHLYRYPHSMRNRDECLRVNRRMCKCVKLRRWSRCLRVSISKDRDVLVGNTWKNAAIESTTTWLVSRRRYRTTALSWTHGPVAAAWKTKQLHQIFKTCHAVEWKWLFFKQRKRLARVMLQLSWTILRLQSAPHICTWNGMRRGNYWAITDGETQQVASDRNTLEQGTAACFRPVDLNSASQRTEMRAWRLFFMAVHSYGLWIFNDK